MRDKKDGYKGQKDNRGKRPSKPLGKVKSDRVSGERTARPERSERVEKTKRFNKSEKREDVIKNHEYDDAENLQLEGRNAVLEALNNNKSIDKVFIKANEQGEVEGTLKVIEAKSKDRGLVVVSITKGKLDEMSQTGNHQGVIAVCPPIEYVEISDILENAKSKNEDPFILILDGITDPHNLGAIIRSADACGVHGVIIPKRRAVGVTGIVSKTSAGAIEHVPIARVTNLTRAIDELKKAGLWVACADMDGKACFKMTITGPIALVIGSEGLGVSRLVKENCDYSINIPMYGKIGSLNASVAAGVLMYEVLRQRKFVK